MQTSHSERSASSAYTYMIDDLEQRRAGALLAIGHILQIRPHFQALVRTAAGGLRSRVGTRDCRAAQLLLPRLRRAEVGVGPDRQHLRFECGAGK
jgi:hypothetical protein